MIATPSRTFVAALALGIATPAALAQTVTWSLVADHPAAVGARSLRSIAVENEHTALYAGFIQGSSTSGARRYALTGLPPVGAIAEFFNVTTQPFPSSDSHQAEAVAVDDRGLVYVASVKDSTSGDNARIYVCAADFATSQKFALADIEFPGTTGETIGGIDFHKNGSTRHLYVTRFRSTSEWVERYVVGGTGVPDATLTLDTTFNGTGQFGLPGGASLRGIDVAPDGTFYVASREANLVWRVPASLTGLTTVIVNRAMDVAFFDTRLYVSTYDGAASRVVELDGTTLSPTGRTFTATGTFPRGATEGYSGIDIDSGGRLYVCDQIYAANSDRILVSSPVCRPDLYETYGAGCSGASLVVPNIEAALGTWPQINQTFTVNITGMPTGGGLWWMLFGIRSDEFDGVPLPIDLGIISMTGCFLRTEVEYTEPGLHTNGTSSWSLAIPNNLDLLGHTFNTQLFCTDPTANPLGLKVSNAKRACIIE